MKKLIKPHNILNIIILSFKDLKSLSMQETKLQLLLTQAVLNKKISIPKLKIVIKILI